MLIWRAPVGGVGGEATQEGGRSHCQVFDEVDWYGVVVVRRGQEVRTRILGYSAEVYFPFYRCG